MAGPLEISVEHAGQVFPFHLHRRMLLLGSAGEADYFWMDGRQFRQRGAGANFRSCVDLWWTAVQEVGAAGEIDNQVNLVLAETYPLISTSRAMQEAYLDAHLHKIADRTYDVIVEKGRRRVETERTFQLGDAERDRLVEIVRSRNLALIRDEMERLFLGKLPPRKEMPAFQEAARAWIGNGITAFRTAGRDGLRSYIASGLCEWIPRLRKRAGLKRVRTYLNMFSYECKVAFYLCHTSAWVGLLPQLVERHGLNEIGERFMRLWHNQNQPQETSDGQLVRDVFCGQVLSLHPLSAIVLTDPVHLTTIGNWIGHADCDRLHKNQEADAYPEYWEMVATILIAAHEYKHSHEQWKQSRTDHQLTDSETVSRQARDDGVVSAALMFEDYAASLRILCSACAGPLHYESHRLPTEDCSNTEVTFRCRACDEPNLISVSADDLADFNSADDND